MSSQLYRSSKIGECLREALFELIESGKITEEVAEKVLTQFDKSTHIALETKVNTKATLKGFLETYRYLDNVWQFVLGKATLRLTHGTRSQSGDVEMDSAKLVCVDSKLIQKEKEDWDMQERKEEHMEMKPLVSVKTEPGIIPKKEDY